MHKRSELITHIQNTVSQYNLPPLAHRIQKHCDREGLLAHFPDLQVRNSIALDLAMIEQYDALLPKLERHIRSCAKEHDRQGVIVPLAPEYNMGGFLRRNELNAFVSQSAHVNPLEQSLSPAQQDRRDSDVQLIDEARTKILLDSVRSAANAHIHSVGCVARPVKRLVNTARDEVECRSAFHLDGRARVMSQDESWNVIGWVVPPPAFPVHVGPGTANRSEHVSSENPGANILEAPRSEVVIDPRCATVGAK